MQDNLEKYVARRGGGNGWMKLAQDCGLEGSGIVGGVAVAWITEVLF
jgi:hypothetical protein